jgi:malate dehydrogenase (oxaloacetate-decarboxylating)(NADP+)
MRIPVIHENLQSPAVVAAAALLNALDLAGKVIGAARVIICGAGTVGLGCAEMFLLMGVDPANLVIYDVNGLLHPDRADLNGHQRRFAQKGAPPRRGRPVRRRRVRGRVGPGGSRRR